MSFGVVLIIAWLTGSTVSAVNCNYYLEQHKEQIELNQINEYE